MKTAGVFAAAIAIVSCAGERDDLEGDGRFASLELETAYAHAFSYLSGVRELSDGKILAADPVSQVLLRVDLDAGTTDTLGRQGQGPNEYNGPDRVFPLPGDSTLLVDLGNGRLTVIDPRGAFVYSMPMTAATGERWGRTVHPTFVDAAGNLYDGGYYSPESPQDTFSLRRIDRATWEEKEVATSWHTAFVMPEPGAKPPMLVLFDDWAVGDDGRIAVVRANGFSVDWYLPDGRVVHGPRNEAESFPVGPAEREAEVEYYAATAVYGVSTVDDDGVQSMRMSRGMPPGSGASQDDYAWPETLPIFRGGGSLVSPKADLWVHRMMPAGGPGRIEVFDDRGIRVGCIDLPPRSKVIGFSATGEPGSTVYLVRTDGVGLIWLERYRVIEVEG